MVFILEIETTDFLKDVLDVFALLICNVKFVIFLFYSDEFSHFFLSFKEKLKMNNYAQCSMASTVRMTSGPSCSKADKHLTRG